ncbi:MAG: hypothetical protein HN874_05685 [Euryarchaeota archaeon]|nr:hypothetical protein [Euryarchaeota archaeon]
MRRAVLVVLLLSLTLVPVSQANGGVINSVTITGNGVVGEGPIEVNISVIGVGGANSASVNWSAVLFDSEGGIIDSDNGNSLVSEGEVQFIETTLGVAPLGISNLTVTLSGDVGTPNSEQWVTYYSSIQRLRPLDISLASPVFVGVNSTGVETSNLTINDGDHARVDIPVINNGDVDWNGSLNFSLDSVYLQPQVVDLPADSTIVYSFDTQSLSEGIHNVSATLVGISDLDTNDNSIISQFEVGPPPLPEVMLELIRINEPQPGANLIWNLSANNSGGADFVGMLVCDFEGEQIFSENVSVLSSEIFNTTVSIVSKPGSLICSTAGARTSTTIIATDNVSMVSAIFIGAGQSTPSLLGGPWHAGDNIILSMLLRNEGDAIGSASMQIEIDGEIQNGTSTTLEGGKAGEVQHVFDFPTEGDHLVNWSVYSQDGAVDSNLSGSISIPVLASQTVIMDVESVEVRENGVEIYWSVDLSEGRERVVVLNFGSVNDGLKSDAIIEERNLLPGKTYGSVTIGFQNGQDVFAKILVNGWSIGFGSVVEDETAMPDTSVNPQVTVNPTTQPKVPAAGNQVNVYYTLTNTGGGNTPEGQIVITDDNGNILNSVVSSATSSSSQDDSTVVTWPNGDNVKIIVSWHVGGKTVSDEVMILSESVEEESESFTIPWGGILGGLVVGMILIFVIRIKTSPKTEKKEKKQKSPKEKSKEEKIEVACPSCDRRLRVPNTYSGSVRCPECEEKFNVEAEVAKEDSSQETSEEDNRNEVLWSSSDNDILGCPKCARKLKVPFDRRPAKARCPACETIFEARAE